MIRWGILATGGIATSFVADLARLPEAEIAAVGSRSPASATTFAAAHRIPRGYGSWAQLAADPEVDVVYVATPHSAHHAATRLCLEAGKAVLCEKPFTLDLATATDLVTLARTRGIFLMEAMWMRTNPAIRRLVEVIAGGAIGTVTHIAADFGLAGPFPPEHRLRARALGGGALLDLGVYPLTLAQLLLGPPGTITAQARLSAEGVDENTAIVLGYDSGALATLHCGLLGDTARRATITGTDGRIELPRPFFCPDGFTLVPAGGVPEQVRMPIAGGGLGYEAEEVMRCLRAGATESPLVPLDETLAVMATLDAVRERIGVTYG